RAETGRAWSSRAPAMSRSRRSRRRRTACAASRRQSPPAVRRGNARRRWTHATRFVRAPSARSATAAQTRRRAPRDRRSPHRRANRRAGHHPRRRRRRRRSNDPERAQLADRLEERAAADRPEQRATRLRDHARSRTASTPAKGIRVELERSGRRSERFLLLAEDHCGEQVEEPVLAGRRRIRVVQPRRRLEDELAFAATADEMRELVDRRHARAAAAHLGAQAVHHELVQPLIERLVDRELDVHLAGVLTETTQLQRLDAIVRDAVLAVDDEAHRARLGPELRELRRWTDEATEHPRTLAPPR